MAILQNNEKIGRYTVVSLIKSNLYTETYKVTGEDENPYFLKLFIMKDVPSQLINNETSQVKEIELCAKLNHKNIVSFIESGTVCKYQGDCQYYVTNYFHGPLLVDYIKEKGKLDEQEALTIFRGILDGLKFLHGQTPCLCHNDLDPTNIILSATNNNEPEVIDVGHLSERCCGVVWFDTADIDLLYHSNETMVGIFDEQSDIFSATMILYTMLTGEVAWNCPINEEGTYKERFMELSRYRKSHALELSALAVSPKVKMVLRTGLELKSEERFSSIDEIFAVLDADGAPSEPKQDRQEQSQSSKQGREQAHQSPNYVEFPIKRGEGNGFEDIAGMCELKESLNKQVVFVIKNKEVAEEYRITPPNGMLLYGPPGCGKTFFAEKFAEETGFNYMLIKSSDLASSYVHGSQEKIRQLFDQAEQNAPIVVCFDEFDALVPDRSWNNVSSEEVNEFLSQMNNCSKRGIFIVATSNRPDKIDPAVLRTGRIDKMVYVPLPDYEARKEMFALYLKDRPKEDGIDVEELANMTEGYIASDIAYIVNDAAMVAAYTRTKISKELLLSSVTATRPSVRSESIKQYDDIRRKMEDKNRRNVTDRSVVRPW